MILLLAACKPAPPAAAPKPADDAAKNIVRDPSRWLSERGATPSNFDGKDCIEIAVGPSREQALLCTHLRFGGNQHPPGAWIDTRRIASVVRAGKIASVLDVGVSLQGEDNGLPRLILQLELAVDRTSVALVDRNIVYPSDPMKAAQVEPSEGCNSNPNDVFLRRLCEGRGTFRWDGSRYVRVP